ncbi:MAG: helix-turn-helix domain-containing protein [Sphingobacteriaceae bacterium]
MEAIKSAQSKYQKKLRSLRLKELRILLKFTQKDMANILNITQVGYFRMENGDNDITVDKIQCLSKEFGLSPTWLICGIGCMFDPKIKTQKTDEDLISDEIDHDLAM